VRLRERLKTLTNYGTVAAILKIGYLERIQDLLVVQSLKDHSSDLINYLGHLATDSTITVANSQCVGTIFEVLNTQILYLGELRKVYLNILMQVLDFKDAADLHNVILQLLRKWIIESPADAFPTIKEKCALALKFMALESYGNSQLFESYLNLVADIYEEDSLQGSELTVKLEPVFLVGTQASNPVLYARFADILDRSLPELPSIRLSYILGTIN
jgi:hypothetical protein